MPTHAYSEARIPQPQQPTSQLASYCTTYLEYLPRSRPPNLSSCLQLHAATTNQRTNYSSKLLISLTSHTRSSNLHAALSRSNEKERLKSIHPSISPLTLYINIVVLIKKKGRHHKPTQRDISRFYSSKVRIVVFPKFIEFTDRRILRQ